MSSRRRKAAARRRTDTKETGSPLTGEPAFLLVGIARRPHGVKGEMLVSIMTDFPERIQPNVELYMGDEYQPVTVRSVRHHNRGLLMAFAEFPDRTAIDHIRNQSLFVHTADRPALPEGEFYLHQIIGMQVITDTGEALGVIVERIETGASNVFVVRRPEGGDVLLPDIEEVVLNIDLENKQMQVHLLDGLLPD